MKLSGQLHAPADKVMGKRDGTGLSNVIYVQNRKPREFTINVGQYIADCRVA
jgi:hypothetical protein